MTEEFLIREALAADVKQIAEIEKVSFKTPWSEEMILSEMKEPLSCFYVAVFQQKIIGYYGFLHILDELHILNVAVDPDLRQKGVGKKLIEHLVEQARALSARAVTLEVRESNLPAIRLYESFGFACAGVRPHYYTDKENALIYWLEL